MKSTKVLIACLFGILSLTLCYDIYAQKPTGVWNGEIKTQIVKLSLIFHFDKTKTTIDCPSQNAKGIPAESKQISPDSIVVISKVIDATFSGRIKKDSIVGKFIQRGHSFPLTIYKGTKEIKRPQTPKPPFTYTTKEVTFKNPKDNAILSGTLSLPKNYNSSTPVVVMVTGSGLQDRNETIAGHKPFWVIADYLARNGVASLRYDDRGFGKSTGSIKNATTETFKQDAEAAYNFMKNQKFDKVGILGHSEGGTIGVILGSEKKADFVISLAGSFVKGAHLLVMQKFTLLQKQNFSNLLIEKYCKTLEEIYKRKANNEDFSKPEAKLQEIIKYRNTSIPEVFQQEYLEIIKSFTPWLDYFIKLDPMENVKNLHAPLLAYNGEKDVQVDAKENTQILITNLPENRKSKVEILDDLNHLFQTCKEGLPYEYSEIEETISPEVLENILNWIKTL